MTDFLKNRYAPFVAIVVFLGLFFYLGTAGLKMPGLYYDECIFVNAATGGTSGPFIHKVILGVPVMIMAYIGALKSFLYYPVFHAFGVSPETIRLPVIILSALTIAIAFLLAKRLFGRLPALLLMGLLATDPAFIYNVRLDFGPVALMLFFKMASLYLFFEFLETRRIRFAWLLLFSLLLGFYDKLNFIWFVAAFVVSAAFVYGRELYAIFLNDKKRLIPLVALFLTSMTIGIFVLVVPVLSYPIPVASISLSDKILYVAKIYLSTMNGSWPFTYVFKLDDIPRTISNYLLLPVAVAVFLSVRSRFGSLVQKRDAIAAKDKPLWFFIFVFAIVFCEIVATKQGGGPHHVMMLYPLNYLMLFAGVCFVRLHVPEKYTTIFVAGCLLVSLAAGSAQLYADTKYVAAFREGRHFTPAWDPAIYRLSNLLEQTGADVVISADWGMQTQLFSLAPPVDRGKYLEGSGVLKRVNPDDPAGAEFLYQRLFKGVNACVVVMGKDTGMEQESGKNFVKLYQNRLQPALFHKKILSAEGNELYEVYGIAGH